MTQGKKSIENIAGKGENAFYPCQNKFQSLIHLVA